MRRGLPLRILLPIVLSYAVVLVLIGAVVLLVRVAPAIVEVRASVEPVRQLFTHVQNRTTAARSLLSDVRVAQPGSESAAGTRAPVRLDEIRARVDLTAPSGSDVIGNVAPGLREPLSRTERTTRRLEQRAFEASAAMELGWTDRTEDLLAQADSLDRALAREVQALETAALDFLVREHAELDAVVGRTANAAILWSVVALLLLPFGAWVVRQRLIRPLQSIERGMAALRDGDLDVSIRQHRNDEIGELVSQFNLMVRSVRDRLDERSRLVASGALLAGVAHEVKNPLMAITGVVSLRKAEGEIAGPHREDLELIDAQVRRAGRLINGLLRFVNDGRSERPRRVDLEDTIDAATELLAYQLEVDDIQLVRERAGVPLPCTIRPIQMEQVLVNILTNAFDAVRARPRPRRVIIRSRATPTNVVVEIEDNGPGVPATMEPHLFSPPIAAGGDGGSGVGLYAANRYVRNAGGRLEHERPEDGGARFRITLPLTPPDHAPAPERDQPEAGRPAMATAGGASRAPDREPLDGYRLLVVDDEEPIRKTIARYLQRRGARVSTAEDGFQALESIASDEPDLIITDLRMPGMDGIELFRTLREDRPALARRVVVLSGDVTLLRQTLAEDDMPLHVILKPVEMKALAEIVSETLHGAATPPS